MQGWGLDRQHAAVVSACVAVLVWVCGWPVLSIHHINRQVRKWQAGWRRQRGWLAGREGGREGTVVNDAAAREASTSSSQAQDKV